MILAQLKMLQDQVATKQVDHKETNSEAYGNDNEGGPSLIWGGYNPCSTSKGIQQELTQGEDSISIMAARLWCLKEYCPARMTRNFWLDLSQHILTTVLTLTSHLSGGCRRYGPLIQWQRAVQISGYGLTPRKREVPGNWKSEVTRISTMLLPCNNLWQIELGTTWWRKKEYHPLPGSSCNDHLYVYREKNGQSHTIIGLLHADPNSYKK